MLKPKKEQENPALTFVLTNHGQGHIPPRPMFIGFVAIQELIP
jgi:hypothetical protein